MKLDLFPATHLPSAYRAWNSALIEGVFPAGRVGVPVYLGVHDSLLDECGARHGCGARADFIRAVLDLGPPANLFAELERLADLWCKSGRSVAPPFVAGLAFAVLAASEMATDERATQANYYVRLNSLLGLDSRKAPKKFDNTLELWRMLQEWLRVQRRGELVISGAKGARRFVDVVQSQCLVRTCDIDDLQSLVEEIDLTSGASQEPELVVPFLRAWLLGAGSRSRLSRLLGRDPEAAILSQAAEAVINAIEEQEFRPEQSWRAPTRRPRAVISIRPNRFPNLMWKRAEWVLRAPASSDAHLAECLFLVGQRVAIAHLDVREPATYDTTITLDEAAALLGGSLRVVNENEDDISPRVRPIAWFQDDHTAGRSGNWTRVDTPRSGEPHVAVLAAAVPADNLLAACDQPPTVYAGAADSWPGPNLKALCNAALRPGASLGDGVTVASPHATLRLFGGLRLSHLAYIRGGLPSVAAPDDARIQISNIEKPSSAWEVAAAGLPGIDLPEGRYELRCGNAIASIIVVEPRWRECYAPQSAPQDREVRTALQSAKIRGAQVAIEAPIYALYIEPGIHYRVGGPKVEKGVAPPDGGIHEVATAAPLKPGQLTIVKRVPARPALPRADCYRASNSPVSRAEDGDQSARANRLLEFASARRSGSVAALREPCATIAGDGTSWHSVLTTLEDLGHLDISWEQRRWTVAPPLLMRRASDEGVAFLAGARTRESIVALARAGLLVSVDERARQPGRSAMPDCVLVKLSEGAKVEAALASLSVKVAPSSSVMDAAIQVRSIVHEEWWLGAELSPPSRVRNELERWNPHLLQWRPQNDGEHGRDGLIRWREHGILSHCIATGGRWVRVRDPSAAKWHVAPAERSHLVFERSSNRLLVPSAMGVPRIWRRILSLASGLTPLRAEQLLVFEGVPLEVARAAAIRLGQSRGEGLL